MHTVVREHDSKTSGHAPGAGRLHRNDGLELAREIVGRVFSGVDAPVAVALAGGEVLREVQGTPAATVVLRSPSILKAILARASDLGAGDAVAAGDVGVTGDVERALGAMDAVAAARSAKDWVAIAALVAKLPRPAHARADRIIAKPAHLRGRVHSLERDRAAITFHYDISNEFYALWLGDSMAYSCAYFAHDGDTLDQAQDGKFDLICRKLRLRSGERLLDVGCGWGGFMRFAAREYGADAVGVTLSRAQAEFARARFEREGLQSRCRVEMLDYRELAALGRFDKAASIGMVEHIGEDNLVTCFRAVFDVLEPGGLFLTQAIIAQPELPDGGHISGKAFFRPRSRFTESYIFPDGQIPRLHALVDAAQRAGFEVRDVENLREHYARTLRLWRAGLESHEAQARTRVGDSKYDLWRFWLAGSARGFATGRLGLSHTLMAKWVDGARAEIPMTRADIYRA